MLEKYELVKEDLNKLQNVLNEAKQDYSEDRECFLKSKIFKMGRFIRFYHEFMKDLEVTIDQDTLEALENFNNPLLITKLNQLKTDWDEFLKILDEKVILTYFFELNVKI